MTPVNHDQPFQSLGIAFDSLPSQEILYKDIETELLVPKDALPAHWLSKYQVQLERQLSFTSLLHLEPSSLATSLSFIRTGLDGHVSGYIEHSNPRLPTASMSTTMDRPPGSSKSFVRGKAGNVPFWPGGLDTIDLDVQFPVSGGPINSQKLRLRPPGFERGLQSPPNLSLDDDNLHSFQPLSLGGGQDSLNYAPEAMHMGVVNYPNVAGETAIDELLPFSRANLEPLMAAHRPLRKPNFHKRDWAHVVDINKPMKNFDELVPEMAHKYAFELDTFQKEAVFHLEMGDSVFVAAHTSAGKTVVAEYAISLAAKHMTRAIYTSPIKALSNQKFRDFKQTFGSTNVGILTGDVQINAEANCLIMTTEILRSMLYKGADLIRDVEFVIFDEVHYVNDAERGVVWEEVIIMLPDHVRIILLSATVPNTKEFAEWVGRTKKKDIYVISTPRRPVPLEHHLYAGREIHKIVDHSGQFLGQGYKDAAEALRKKQDKEREAAGLAPYSKGGGRGTGRGTSPAHRGTTPGRIVAASGGLRTFHQPDKNLYVHLLGNLRKRSLLPTVVFTLSKKRCEENASTLINSDLCSALEKSEVHVTLEKALSRLKGSDKKLPQIGRMRDLLSRGIGVHHGGLLPIVKEVVEILFSRGLVKVLFATETFAMGVNMPAKCVVFSGIRKHDGKKFREILPGEYTQMAGRAGRRGLDPTGTVIIVVDHELPELTTLHTMILGKPNKLQSQFRLTYNMILNLLRVEALKVEEMIKRSFSENASQRLVPEQQKKVAESEKLLERLVKLECKDCEPSIYALYDNSLATVTKNHRLLTLVTHTAQSHKILCPGRVVVLRDSHFRANIAVLLKPAPVSVSDNGEFEKTKTYFVLALVDHVTKERKHDLLSDTLTPVWPLKTRSLMVEDGTYEFRPVPLSSIVLVTNRAIKIEVEAIVTRNLIREMNNTAAQLQDLLSEWLALDTAPEVEWSRMRTVDFQETVQERDRLSQRLLHQPCSLCPDFDEHYHTVHAERILQRNIADLKLAISDQNLELVPDYEQRIEVLKELKFINENSTVLLKGRVACEINSVNELVLTELILENTLANYTPEEVVALLSSFVFQEKTDVDPTIPPKLEEGKQAILALADRVGRVQDSHKVAATDFQMTLKFGLVEVVYEWAKGMPFEQITSLTDIAEGTIVRVITRLDETCREVRDAARVIGDASLFKKMEEAQIKIKRDIVFAASLYF